MERRRSAGEAMELPACKAVGAYHPQRDTAWPVRCPCTGILWAAVCFQMSKYTNDLPVYHTRNGIVSIMWCLHRSIEEKHFNSRLLCGYSRKKHEKIQDYIQNQLKEDQIAEQLELKIEDPLHCFALSVIIWVVKQIFWNWLSVTIWVVLLPSKLSTDMEYINRNRK